MIIQLIEGNFNSHDTLDLITQMIHIKIKYQENKISSSENEEDTKAREAKIKRLQKELYNFRNNVDSSLNHHTINAIINID